MGGPLSAATAAYAGHADGERPLGSAENEVWPGAWASPRDAWATRADENLRDALRASERRSVERAGEHAKEVAETRAYDVATTAASLAAQGMVSDLERFAALTCPA